MEIAIVGAVLLTLIVILTVILSRRGAGSQGESEQKITATGAANAIHTEENMGPGI